MIVLHGIVIEIEYWMRMQVDHTANGKISVSWNIP